jgi:hypothetical protein
VVVAVGSYSNKSVKQVPWRIVYGPAHVGIETKGNRIRLYDTNELVDAQGDPNKGHDYYVDCFLQWRLFKARETQLWRVGVAKRAQLWVVFCENPKEAIDEIVELRAKFLKTKWGRRCLLHEYCLLERIPCANSGFCPHCAQGAKRFQPRFRSHPSYQKLSQALQDMIALEVSERAIPS